jgi:DNA polymerase III delta prime subunit
MMLSEYLWTERFRPKTVADTILPADLKSTFQTFVDQKNIPNLLLSGGPGIGKTTAARAMMEEVGCDYIVINGSMNGNIDTLRNEILNFASSVSLSGGRKIVLLDEADYLTQNVQAALRNFMEEFSKNCGFILTCNYKNRIIKPLHSRCSVIDFALYLRNGSRSWQRNSLSAPKSILTQEGIKYDRTVVGTLIQKFFPDWRRVLNELQRYSATGAVDSGILTSLADVSIQQVLTMCKAKDYDGIRKWVHDNADQEQTNIFRAVYEYGHEAVDRKSIPELIVIIADYSYKAAFVADHEINLVAFFVELMMRLEWKD